MKRITVLALSALVIGILACGGGSDDEGAERASDEADEGGALTVDLPDVEMSEPWASMNLPVGSGQVVLSDDTVLLVGYDSGSVSGVTGDWTPAIKAAGYSQKEDYSTPDFTAILFEKSGKQVGFAVGTEQDITFAYMEDLSKVDESESTIASARKGNRKIRKASKSKMRRKGRKSGKRGGKTTGGKRRGTKGN